MCLIDQFTPIVGRNAVIDISLFINTYSYVDYCYEYDITQVMVRLSSYCKVLTKNFKFNEWLAIYQFFILFFFRKASKNSQAFQVFT